MGSRPVLLRNPSIFVIFQRVGGGAFGPLAPPPSGSAHVSVVVDSMLTVVLLLPLCVCVWGGSLFFCAVFSVLPSLQSSRWGVSALCLFLKMPWVGLHCVIVAFPFILTYLLRVGHIERIHVCNVIKLHVLHKIFIFRCIL